MHYQPLPWIGKTKALRDAGVDTRWESISTVLDEVSPGSALDVGSQVGFFALAIARRGTPTVAVERNPQFYRTLLYAKEKMELDNVGLLVMPVEPHTVQLLPAADAVVFMSVWHHMYREHGDAAAREMLRTIWAHTGKVLFFETGESEMPPRYHVPDMAGDPVGWITKLLEQECEGATITHLGRNEAFAPDETPCTRSLFAVRREGA